jgi:ABC-2 type transport system ATP-binding protein
MKHVDVSGLRKTYRTRGRKPVTVEAVRGIDVQAESGSIVGILGPNGAGKSTTIRMLATLTRPDAGAGTVAGHDLLADPEGVRAGIGYVGQNGGADESCDAWANLVFAARLGGVGRDEASARAADLLETFELTPVARRPVRTLSGGQKRRVCLALGLIRRPTVLLLDEPTTGLDPQNRANLWDHIRRLRDQGTCVLLSTHYLDEADALCDRLMIIDGGEVVVEGEPAILKQSLAGDVITLGADLAGAVRETVVRQTRDLPGIRSVQPGEGGLRVCLDDGERILPRLIDLARANNVPISTISLDRASLDDVFLAKTGRSLRDAG